MKKKVCSRLSSSNCVYDHMSLFLLTIGLCNIVKRNLSQSQSRKREPYSHTDVRVLRMGQLALLHYLLSVNSTRGNYSQQHNLFHYVEGMIGLNPSNQRSRCKSFFRYLKAIPCLLIRPLCTGVHRLQQSPLIFHWKPSSVLPVYNPTDTAVGRDQRILQERISVSVHNAIRGKRVFRLRVVTNKRLPIPITNN